MTAPSNSDTVAGWTIRQHSGTWFPALDQRRKLTGFTLTDPDGHHVMIDGHGHVAPNYRSAVLERDKRLTWG